MDPSTYLNTSFILNNTSVFDVASLLNTTPALEATLYHHKVACTAAALPFPTLFGSNITSLEANLVENFSRNISIGAYSNHGAVSITNATFCNVTISYTHPGQNDNIQVQMFLPQDTWNGRMQQIGGTGYQAGLHPTGILGMLAAMGQGYASLGTNAGLPSDALPDKWALVSPGNVNLYALENLITVSLSDAALIGKSIVNSYYGIKPFYSYFTGCSQGGRQGFALAQRYPDLFEGIAASAPAFNMHEFFMTVYYGPLLMNLLKEYPAPCEFNAITDAILKACDPIDGLVDGVIADPSLCNFDISSVVGQSVSCNETGSARQVSTEAALIAQAIFTGPRKTDGSFMASGIEKGGVLTGPPGLNRAASLVPTTCSTTGECSLLDGKSLAEWITYFVLKDATADITNMTHQQFDNYFHTTVQQYRNLGFTDPDLTAFSARGGKIVGYHGLSDQIIPTNDSLKYYDAVSNFDPKVHDYYRLFLAPGLGHCIGGKGAYPAGTFNAMRKWVEKGIAPDILKATSLSEPVFSRILCPYPKKQYYNGKNTAVNGGFYCK